MARVDFYLKEPKAEQDTLIYLFLFHNSVSYKFSTGEHIHPKLWNKKKKRVRESAQFPQYPEFNASLDRMEQNVLNAFRGLLNSKDGLPPKPTLRKALIAALKADGSYQYDPANEVKEPVNLIAFIEELIAASVTQKAPATVDGYRATLKHLKEFQALTGYPVEFDTINLEFFDQFRYYMNMVKGISNNSLGQYITTIKSFMNEAYERDLHSNLSYRKRSFKVTYEQVDNIYLTEKELQQLYQLDLSGQPRLERVRDLFLVSCYTGLRHSDWDQVKPENIKDGIVKVLVRKTNEWVSLPVHPVIKSLLEKYEGTLPRTLTNAKTNQYLKEIGQCAGFTASVTMRKSVGSKRKKLTRPKFELISSHTARRSFATNAFLAGVPTLSIMKLTGHKSERSFMKYIKMSAEDNARLMMNHAFFRGEEAAV